MVNAIVTQLKRLVPKGAPLHEPVFKGKESLYVQDCIESGWVSSVGAYVDRLERALAELTGSKRAVALCNGTCSLDLGLRLLGVQPGDEVLVPAISFVATANAVTYSGAIPHFVDVDRHSIGMDPVRLRAYLRSIAKPASGGGFVNRNTGRRLFAMIPMHALGHPADLEALCAVGEEFGLHVVEDAAEALGSLVNGKHVGTRGRFTMLSFNGNKIVTTGGGGALLTQDDELGKLAKHVSTTAKLPHAWRFDHDRIGFNYRMPNLNAALGCAQLELLPRFLKEKRQLAERYEAALAEVPGVKFHKEPSGTRSNYWLCALALDRPDAESRDAILAACHQSGILARPLWTPLPDLPAFKECPKDDLPNSRDWDARIVCLPSGVKIMRALQGTGGLQP